MTEDDKPIDLSSLTASDMPQIPEPHFAAVGRMVDACAGLDLCIDYMIWELLGIDQLSGACVTAQMISIHPRMHALLALAHLKGATASLVELRKFYTDMGGLAEKRNRLVHDKRLVNYHTEEVAIFTISAKHSLKFGIVQETTKELDGFAQTMKSMTKRFEAIAEKIRHEISKSPHISPLEKERLYRLRIPAETPDSA